MKVYVITCGEYSDYHICAVEVDKDRAERICGMLNKKTRNGSREYELCEIEEYDTDEIKVDSEEEVNLMFTMHLGYKTGKIHYFSSPSIILGENNWIKVQRGYKDESRIIVNATFPKRTTEDKAKKVMLDRAAKFKAEKGNI